MDKILVDACTPLLDHFNKRPEDGSGPILLCACAVCTLWPILLKGARLKTRDETLGGACGDGSAG